MGDAEIIPLGTRGRPGPRHRPRQARPRPRATSPAGRAAPPRRRRRPDGRRRRDRRPTRPDDDAPPSAEPTSPTPSRRSTRPSTPPSRSARPTDAAGSTPSTPRARPLRAERRRAGRATDAGVTGVGPTAVRRAARRPPTRAAQVVFGEDADQKLAELLAFLRRRVTGDYVVDEYGIDPEITERFLLELVRPLATKWFRVEVRGVENIPTDGGALVVANHSGTVPIDGLITMFAVHETTGRNLRPLGADLVFRLPFVGELARKAGATLACNEDADPDAQQRRARRRSGRRASRASASPTPSATSCSASAAAASSRPRSGPACRSCPCSIVGAEEIYPLVGNIPSLARLLGVPYIPITPFFPLLGPLGLVPLPSKWIIEFGEPIRTDSYDPGAADDPMLVFNVTDQVRETIQQTLYSLLMRRKSVFH